MVIWPPPTQTLRLGPLETKLGAWTSIWGLGLVIWGLDEGSGPWTRNLDLGLGFLGLVFRLWNLGQEIWALEKESGAWIRILGPWTSNLVLG